ncbi:MAG: hypothetical protein AAGK23_13225, partial [Pseudomonadota bacterium]
LRFKAVKMCQIGQGKNLLLISLKVHLAVCLVCANRLLQRHHRTLVFLINNLAKKTFRIGLKQAPV